MSEENKPARPKLKLALSKSIDVTKNSNLSLLLGIKNKVEEKQQDEKEKLKAAKDKHNNSAVKSAVLVNTRQKPNAVASKDKTQSSAIANKNSSVDIGSKTKDKEEDSNRKANENKSKESNKKKHNTSDNNDINSKGHNGVEQAKLATTEENKKSSQEPKKLNRYSFKTILKKLHEVHPGAFPEEDKIVALKIGIKEDIKSNEELMKMLKLSNNYLGEFLRWYTSSKNYRQNALLLEAARYDLAGEVAGEVTQMQADEAKKKLAASVAKRQADEEVSSLQVVDNDKSNE